MLLLLCTRALMHIGRNRWERRKLSRSVLCNCFWVTALLWPWIAGYSLDSWEQFRVVGMPRESSAIFNATPPLGLPAELSLAKPMCFVITPGINHPQPLSQRSILLCLKYDSLFLNCHVTSKTKQCDGESRFIVYLISISWEAIPSPTPQITRGFDFANQTSDTCYIPG